MILYGSPLSCHTRRVRIFCDEAGIDYTYKSVNLMDGEQHRPEVLALNPNGKVPVIDDGGFVLNESHTIMRYLADKYGQETWYPKALEARARVDAWLDWVHTRLGIEVGKVFLHTLVFGERGDPQKIEEAKGWLSQILPVMNTALEKQSHLAGEQITLADIAAATSLSDLEQARYPLDAYPAIQQWYQDLTNLRSFKATYCPVTDAIGD